jgi:putative SOS response-associated peptidase YedK
MCGRYAITLPKEAMIGLFDLADAPDLQPRYNVAPSQLIPVIAIGGDGARKAVMMRWGLHPMWMKEPPGAKSMINARSETAAEKPFFRAAFKKRRCLLAMDGYYEWHRAEGQKTPHFIHRKDRAPLVVAGLWEQWGAPGEGVLTAALLTTSANAHLAPIHDRMPCILSQPDWSLWLDPAAPREVLEPLLQPLAGDDLEAYRVSRAVNSPAGQGAGLIAPE